MLVAVASLVIVVALGSGCAGRSDPRSYNAGVRKNFIEGCVATSSATEKPSGAEVKQRTVYCGCLYDKMTDKDTGISFDEFKSAQEKIQSDPTKPANAINKVIPGFDKFVSSCTTGVGGS